MNGSLPTDSEIWESKRLAELAADEPSGAEWWQGSWEVTEGRGTEFSDLLCFFDDEGKPRVWSYDTVGKHIVHHDPRMILALHAKIDALKAENHRLRESVDWRMSRRITGSRS